MKKAICVLLTSILIVSLITGCGSTNTEGGSTGNGETSGTSDHSDWIQMNLTYATMLPEDHPSQEQINMFIEKCDERMDGLVSITTYPSSSMISMTDMYNGIKNDVCDMGFLVTSNAVGVLDMALLCDEPGFYYESGTASAMAMYDYYMWLYENTDEFSEVVPLTVLGLAPRGIECNKEINSIEDLQGLNLYAAASYLEGLSRWGITGSTMDYSEIYESVRNGLLDGTIFTVGEAANMMLQEIVDYCYVTHVIGQANAIIINRDVFETMPESQQELFLELWKEVQEEYVNLYLEDFTYGDDTMSQDFCAEVKNLDVFPEEMELEMLKLVEDIPDTYAAELDAKGLKGTEALEYYRERLEYYNELYPGSMDGYYSWREE